MDEISGKIHENYQHFAVVGSDMERHFNVVCSELENRFNEEMALRDGRMANHHAHFASLCANIDQKYLDKTRKQKLFFRLPFPPSQSSLAGTGEIVDTRDGLYMTFFVSVSSPLYLPSFPCLSLHTASGKARTNTPASFFTSSLGHRGARRAHRRPPRALHRHLLEH